MIVCVCLCMCVYLHVQCVFVCIHAFIFVCVCVFICVYVCVLYLSALIKSGSVKVPNPCDDDDSGLGWTAHCLQSASAFPPSQHSLCLFVDNRPLESAWRTRYIALFY